MVGGVHNLLPTLHKFLHIHTHSVTEEPPPVNEFDEFCAIFGVLVAIAPEEFS